MQKTATASSKPYPRDNGRAKVTGAERRLGAGARELLGGCRQSNFT